jgi:putative hydrolase of the HAD superfamily
LAEQGVADVALAEEVGERFGTERRARHEVFADVAAGLAELSETYVLALVTNGASCLQREKLAACGLGDYFAAVVVSAEFGVGKPDGAIFRYALTQVHCDTKHAVMVGDSLSRDVNGAVAASLGAVCVNRVGRLRPDRLHDAPEAATLSDLRAVLSVV